jgi:hypothetical protein
MTDTAPQPTGTQVAATAPAKPKAELVAGAQVAPIIPRDIDEVARIANAVIVAGLAPDSYRGNDDRTTASKIMIGILKGAEIGLAPLTALASIAIINGRPCLWGDGAVALIQNSGKVEKWEENFTGEEGQDTWTAHCAIWRKGQELPYEGSFSWGDAKRAKLTAKGPWVQYSTRMMMWRARTYAMRLGFADCLSGLAIAEEAQDIPAAPPPADLTALDDDVSDAPAAAEPTPQVSKDAA